MVRILELDCCEGRVVVWISRLDGTRVSWIRIPLSAEKFKMKTKKANVSVLGNKNLAALTIPPTPKPRSEYLSPNKFLLGLINFDVDSKPSNYLNRSSEYFFLFLYSI